MNRYLPGDYYRFFAKVEKTGTCWLWTGSKGTGGGMTYGQFWLELKLHQAHRASYKLFNGDIPTDMTIDHICKVGLCVNPQHLRLLTIGENVLCGNGVSGINARKTQCHKGHEFDKENTRVTKLGHRQCRRCRKEYFDRLRTLRDGGKAAGR
jgi:hypothetical protein